MVLDKLQAKVDKITLTCLVDKLYQDYYTLIIIFCGIIGIIFIFILIGFSLKIYMKKCKTPA